jgi:hypothetical protein
MKIRQIDVDVKIIHDDGSEQTISVSDKYQEPETWSEVSDLQMSEDEKLRAFSYGLYNIKSGKVRSSHNFGSLARKLVESGVFGSTKEALEFVIRRRDEKK